MKPRYKKPDSLKAFEKAYNEWEIEKEPAGWYHVNKKFRDDSERGMRVIMKAFSDMHGWKYENHDAKGSPRINHIPLPNGRTRQVVVGWNYSKEDKGHGDGRINIPVNGLSKSVWIDVKMRGDYQNDNQKLFEVRTVLSNEAYFLALDFEKFHNGMKKVCNEIGVKIWNENK